MNHKIISISKIHDNPATYHGWLENDWCFRLVNLQSQGVSTLAMGETEIQAQIKLAENISNGTFKYTGNDIFKICEVFGLELGEDLIIEA